jgi:hypothetical protein
LTAWSKSAVSSTNAASCPPKNRLQSINRFLTNVSNILFADCWVPEYMTFFILLNSASADNWFG